MVRVGNKKRVKRVTGMLLGAAILFGGSLTVCAYEDTRVIKDVDQSIIETAKDTQSQWEFVKDEEAQAAGEATQYATEFVADDGTCYDLSETQNGGMERAGCFHEFESGYIKIHEKNADGSCKTDYHKAEMCYKCGYVIMKGYSHTESWTKCPH